MTAYSSYRQCIDCNSQTRTLVTYEETRTVLVCEVCGSRQVLGPLRIRKPRRREIPAW
jgi:transcription elongation factor Elf1